MANLELYYLNTCPYSQRVLQFIKDNNLVNQIRLKEIKSNDEYRDTLENIGGRLQVPCLFVDGEPMYESEDIIEYLKGV